MAQYLAPGVYVEETGPPRSIEGVPTGIAAFLGQAAKGPLAPTLVRSVRDYAGIYGEKDARGSFLGPAVRAFFANGGTRAWIARIKGAGASDHVGTIKTSKNGKTVAATGLTALADLDEIGLVAAPGAAAEAQHALVAHCESLRNRVAILDAPHGPGDVRILDPRGTDPALASGYAAYYAPWLEVDGPGGSGRMLVPPSGAVCGIIARVDAQRGVWKAPANEVVTGVHGLETAIDENAQALLNARGVNVIRAFPGRGILLWGARTLSQDGQWRYVSVRRLAIYIEHSIGRGLQWAVFEPNGSILQAQARQLAENFLYRIWLDGGLMGAKASEAYYVRCDRTTMTQDDIDMGRLIMEVGFAPVRPAEFVVLRLALRSAPASA